MEKLSITDLSFCIGANAVWHGDTYKISGINTTDAFNPVCLNYKLGNIWVKEDEVTPILRNLCDITEDEASLAFEILYREKWLHRSGALRTIESARKWLDGTTEHLPFVLLAKNSIIGYHGIWRYFLSRHFDIFGWIPMGLAINHKSLSIPPIS